MGGWTPPPTRLSAFDRGLSALLAANLVLPVGCACAAFAASLTFFGTPVSPEEQEAVRSSVLTAAGSVVVVPAVSLVLALVVRH